MFWLHEDLPLKSAGNTAYLIPGSLLPETRSTAAAEILIEALKRAGRGLSRFTLMEALESLHQVRTSMVEPISFGPIRRIGASQVRILKFDPRTQKLIAQR